MTNTPSPDEDRELIERLRKCADGLPSHGYDWFRGNMWEAADRLESLLSDRAKLEEALRIFIKAAYPVASEINPRGYNWSEAYLDEARVIATDALNSRTDHTP